MKRDVASLVLICLERGSLLGNDFGNTVTVNGRRRWTIRVQSDVFRVVQGFALHDAYYPDLIPEIAEAVAEWQRTAA